MIQFGQTLKAARETKGLSIQQVAETTKLMSSVIEGLENEDFSRIVVPIYGRGFVKLYCEAVGLEPKPMVEEFMRLFTEKNEPKIAPKAESSDEPAAENASEKKNRSFAPAYSKDESLSPSPFFEKYLALRAATLRLGALALGAIILLSLLIFGIRALYRATTSTETSAESVPPAATAAAPRTPKAIEPLYMD